MRQGQPAMQRVLGMRANLYEVAGDTAMARQFLKESVELAHEHSQPWMELQGLVALGNSFLHQGEYSEAVDSFSAALVVHGAEDVVTEEELKDARARLLVATRQGLSWRTAWVGAGLQGILCIVGWWPGAVAMALLGLIWLTTCRLRKKGFSLIAGTGMGLLLGILGLLLPRSGIPRKKPPEEKRRPRDAVQALIQGFEHGETAVFAGAGKQIGYVLLPFR